MLDETIVAVATANGIGSISIVRVSGKEALPIALKLTKKQNYQPRLATLSTVYNNDNEVIDEALIIYFKNPFSFTGEDVVEFQCHGGLAITQILVKEIIKCGARIANPGEFSKRAFLNGKMDLTKAEAISKLIEARSEDGVKLLARQLKGELKEFVDEIREDLLFSLAYTEVSIDYAEEDLPANIYEQIENKLNKIEQKLEETLSASKRRDGLIEGFKVAIIGKPNVGKSSLLNKLLSFDRAIISDIAGTTRDTIEESVRIGTHIIKIVDTAGIREATEVIEKIGIEKSINVANEADIIIALFDNSREIDREDEKIIELLDNSEKEKVIVINKSDLASKLDKSKFENYVELSTKENITTLVDTLEKILDNNTHSDEMTLISTRQVDAVSECLNSLKESFAPLKFGELEMFAYHINEAILSISSISKPYDNEQMLDVMFGEFCLGK